MPRAPLEYNATLIERHDITPRLAIFRVEPDERAYAFVPGQYTVVGLKQGEPRLGEDGADVADGVDPEKMIRRPYSICSSVHQPEALEFYISLLSGGELTPRLFNLEPGARLFVGDKPRGTLTLEKVPEESNVLLVATGTGLGPYVSMLRSHARAFPAKQVGVIQGASYARDLGYLSELRHYAAQLPNFHYLPTVSRPDEDPDWTGATGRVQHWIWSADFANRFEFPLEPERVHVFLCGNPNMIIETQELLLGRGFTLDERGSEGDLHVEKYW
ncbi:MAG: ferredoxin--NADP reductase [Gammaproteobacteria bacterium]|nr:ferredoxin--NADP reductase [Gammaproteobacteria bacterium]